MSQRIEEALERALSEVDAHGPPQVGHAIRYAVFPGGARVRPRLAGAVAEAIGGAHAPTGAVTTGTATAFIGTSTRSRPSSRPRRNVRRHRTRTPWWRCACGSASGRRAPPCVPRWRRA